MKVMLLKRFNVHSHRMRCRAAQQRNATHTAKHPVKTRRRLEARGATRGAATHRIAYLI